MLILCDLTSDLIVITVLLSLKSLVLSVQTLIEDALQLRVDVQPIKVILNHLHILLLANVGVVVVG